jgi:hypothetical protein
MDELDAQKDARATQAQADARRQFLSQILSPRAVPNTTFVDQDKRPCAEDTRTEVMRDIGKWVHDISGGSQSVLWLTGVPGCGKSTITASVAGQCNDERILWAQFFINRGLSNTTNPASYFPSIAQQLADRSEDVAVAVHDALKEWPSLMDDISQNQAGILFVQSLKVASATDPSKPVVVLIDGLDETDVTRLRDTATIFSQALAGLPRNAKVLISSRTEDDIRKPFSPLFQMNHVKHIHLDTNSSIKDVSTFLRNRVADIVHQNDLDVPEWPEEEQMRTLCNQASGLFIWAATAVKFIKGQIDLHGRERLKYVFEELNSKGMGDINVLYGAILRLTQGDDSDETDPWIFERFRRIVGCIVVLQAPLCLIEIGDLLDLRRPGSTERVDIQHFIRRLRTVLVPDADAINGRTIPRLHSSFSEYISSDRADPRFRINTELSHGEISIRCLGELVNLGHEHSTSLNDNSFRGALRYASEFWTSHLRPGTMAGVAVAGSLKDPPLPSDLQKMLQSAFDDNTQPACVHVTLTSGHGRKQVVSSSDDVICFWDAKTGAQIRFPIKGHTESVHSVAFSPDPDKEHIISGSGDGTLRLWDARSGQPIGEPFEGHKLGVCSVDFSPDGKRIVSGSEDRTLRLWDAESGKSIGAPFNGHTKVVLSVAYSRDGTRIVSGSKDNTLRVWDASNGKPIGSSLKGHTDGVDSVAFSRDGKKIVSAQWTTQFVCGMHRVVKSLDVS